MDTCPLYLIMMGMCPLFILVTDTCLLTITPKSLQQQTLKGMQAHVHI